MMPLMRKSFLCMLYGQNQNHKLFMVTRTITTTGPRLTRTFVSSSSPSWPYSSSSCSSCGIPQRQDKVNGMGKSMQLLNNSTRHNNVVIPKVSQQQVSSISTSCVVTAAAGAVNMQGNPAVAHQSGVQWDLYAGIVLERKPIITSKKNDLQEKYSNFLAQLEFETSKKSDHEVRHDNDLKMLEKVKAGDIDLGNVQTARDDEDRWNAEAQSFTPESRETDADRKKDIRSLDRALDSHLLLVVEQKLGQDYRWICPHAKIEQGETLRQAAEKMLRAVFPDMRTKILGHAPWGFYKYKYPKSTPMASTGAKVFFYKAEVVAGEAIKDSGNAIIKDFVWLKRDELPSKLLPEYYKKLSECLIDDIQ